MASTTDFATWWDENYIETHDEIYSLYLAVESDGESGGWPVQVNGDKLIIEGNSSNLALVSQKARAAFLEFVESKTGDDELDIHSWHSFRTNLDKDNS